MTHFNIVSARSYAVATFAVFYCSVILLALIDGNGAQLGQLIV